ncbi:exocyst complex component 7 isoform X3 [Belonocnema kinseyi]|nr:exocyst complex component 7 isoform X3 [Belonocnema kinseyi]XP_033214374.1 exocyst complex component 7 isoform X3 [Belonocnema kinseyi]XP_033214375.1 exocyst complex component 7 isoform X3 [Belonocnema kinseyi]XP_033214378.1 exocyst complex component 7 isoform X3 [Belonocnema kinseyi]
MYVTEGETSERRFEIECKLEAENTGLEALKDAQNRSQRLTSNMVAIISSLEERLATLRRTILPVYNETGNLQSQQHSSWLYRYTSRLAPVAVRHPWRRKVVVSHYWTAPAAEKFPSEDLFIEDAKWGLARLASTYDVKFYIEKTLTILDHAIGYYGVCQEVEGSVRGGPNGAGGLDGFLEVMNRLYNAQHYFQKNNPSSVELENVSTLFGTGLEALYAEFHDNLARQSKPVLPIVLLDLISSDEDTSGEDAPQFLCQLPESTVANLVKIAHWLEERALRHYVDMYASVRSAIVLRSLQLMKEHHRSASGGSMHAGSPMMKPKFAHRHSISAQENVGRKTSRRLQHALEKKASKMFLKASHTTGIGLSFPSSRKPLPMPSNYPIEDTAPEEQEMENYLLLTASLHKLMQVERALVARILSTNLQPQVLEATVRDAMDLVTQDGESIASRAKRCIIRRDFSAVLVIFPILKHLGELKPDLERTVEGCDYALRSKFASVISTLNTTGAKALDDFADSVRNESGTALPKDGTVAESTSNVIVFLEQLIEYADTAGAVLNRNEANPISSSKATTERTLLGSYIKKVLAQLNLALVTRSDSSYSDAALRSLFRLNNHNYVINALRRSSLMELLLLAEPNAERTYEDILLRNQMNYVTYTFSKVKLFVEQPSEDADLNPKVLKERFLAFTKEFDEVTKHQRTFSVPDARLREELRKELNQSLTPYYTSFYNKYRKASFSKNPGKYIKYTPEQVSSAIRTFFDGVF